MKIACLGWGSLVWDPRDLPIRSRWFEDGPLVPVEFVRMSRDGRITLVIEPSAAAKTILWAHMKPANLSEAATALCRREGIPDARCRLTIGSWKGGQPAPPNFANLTFWAEAHEVGAVVWTALGPTFHRDARSPSANEVIEYLRGLQEPVRGHARKYIECAPRQIDTAYRSKIKAALGWSIDNRDAT